MLPACADRGLLCAEFLGHMKAGEKFNASHEGPGLLKLVFRPTLADLRAVTLGPGGAAQARKNLSERDTCCHKYEPVLDLDDVVRLPRQPSAPNIRACADRHP